MRTLLTTLIAALPLWLGALPLNSRGQTPDVAEIKPGVRSGFSQAGWKYDRYSDLPSLDAHARMTVADLKGPGMIRHLHVTRHHPEQLASRGIVLEIYFDGAEEPAVMCPLADFFGDGCGGDGMHFSSSFIECAPWSYNGYFPMPFRERARVVLRNDTDRDIMDYSFVEWENLPEWNDRLGYFHATYRRKCFQLTKDSDEMFFEVEGSGHVLGRQFSVVTDEPFFRAYNAVMEGNNEVDIDGQPRRLDYLGTEDSFTFSWGFQETFAGQRAGMTLVEHGDLNRLSIYRFHDHMPIRFNKSLKWHINWRHEKFFTGNPKWQEAAARGGCWVDYATVYYWYERLPGGFKHQPLRPLDERMKTMLHPVSDPPGMRAALERMPVDPRLENTFDTEEDLKRVITGSTYAETHPFWIDRPRAEGGHPGNPNPGRQGILGVHAKGPAQPCLIVRKVTLPSEKDCCLRLVVSGDPYEAPGQSDFSLQAGVFDGTDTKWFDEEVIDAGTPPSADHWQTLEYPLTDYAGKTVGIVVKVAYGGKVAALNEEAFFDEISVQRATSAEAECKAVCPSPSTSVKRIAGMSGSVRIVALGDSITNGVGLAGVNEADTFRDLVRRELGERLGVTVEVVNAGVNGDVVTLAVERLARDVLDRQPDLVTIMFGGNEAGFYRPQTNGFADTPRVSREKFAATVANIVDRIRAAGIPAVLMTCPPMTERYWGMHLEPYQEHGINFLVKDYAQAIRDVAAEKEVELVDVYRTFQEDPNRLDYFPDGLHPDARGHRVIADLLVERLARIIGPPPRGSGKPEDGA